MLTPGHLGSEQVQTDPMRWFISMAAVRDIARGKQNEDMVGMNRKTERSEETRYEVGKRREGRRNANSVVLWRIRATVDDISSDSNFGVGGGEKLMGKNESCFYV
jgi:hypothetical protein